MPIAPALPRMPRTLHIMHGLALNILTIMRNTLSDQSLAYWIIAQAVRVMVSRSAMLPIFAAHLP